MIIDSIIELNLSAVLPTSYREYVLNKYPMYKEKFFFINYFPFDIFMKEFKIAIHHGGSGTTHACLKSGVPQLILAFGADQFFWGEQCYEKQIGTFPLDVKKDISKNEIKDKIVEIIRCDRFKQKAIELSKQISLHGVEDAAKIIEEYSFRKN